MPLPRAGHDRHFEPGHARVRRRCRVHADFVDHIFLYGALVHQTSQSRAQAQAGHLFQTGLGHAVVHGHPGDKEGDLFQRQGLDLLPQFLDGHVLEDGRDGAFLPVLRNGRGRFLHGFPVPFHQNHIGVAPDDDGPARALRAADHGFDEEVFLRVAKAHLNGNGIQKRVGPAYGVLVHIGEDFQALVPVAAGKGQGHGEFYAVLTGSRDAHAARVLKMLPLRRTRTSLMSPRLSSWARDTARAMAAGSVQPRAGLTLRLSKETRWSRYMFFPFRADDVLKALRQPRGRTPA